MDDRLIEAVAIELGYYRRTDMTNPDLAMKLLEIPAIASALEAQRKKQAEILTKAS